MINQDPATAQYTFGNTGTVTHNTVIHELSTLADRKPAYALVGAVDLVVARFDDEMSVFHEQGLHRDALMSDGHVRGRDPIWGVPHWDDRLNTAVSASARDEKLSEFTF